jgi:hypothetical protein
MLTSRQMEHPSARTELYRSLGTLRGAELLRSWGVATSTEQMYLLVRFVIEVLGTVSGTEKPKIHNSEIWLSERLGECFHSGQCATSNLGDWHKLFEISRQVLDWDPYREFADLLEMRHSEDVFRRTAREASRDSNGPSMGFILSVAEEFREKRLPTAVHGFDPERGKGHEEAWLSVVFRWFLLRRATADRSVREQLKFVATAESTPSRPDEILEKLEEQRIAENIQTSLHAMEAKHVDALRSYFGLDGRREHALQEIARQYGISHHTARWLIVDALTALSVRLGVEGVLSEEEFAFAHLVFGKGMPTKIAAHQLNLGESTIRRSIQAKFRAALRKRTTIRERSSLKADDRPPSTLNRAVATESSYEHTVPKMKPEQIAEGLRQLSEVPKIFSEGDQKFVSLPNGAASLSEVRSFLAEHEEFCDDLIEKYVPLEWVFTHDGERVDVFSGTVELENELEKIASREWSVAAFVYGECVKNLGGRKLSQLTERSATDEPVARIFETLEGLSVAFLRTIDPRLRHTRPPLCLWREENTIVFRWEGGPAKAALTPFVLRQAMRFGEFHYDAGTVVASTVSTMLLSGDLPLPGFDLEKPANGFQILRPRLSGLR